MSREGHPPASPEVDPTQPQLWESHFPGKAKNVIVIFCAGTQPTGDLRLQA